MRMAVVDVARAVAVCAAAKQLPIALGNFDEIFSNLTDKTYVSKLDLSKAYDQLAVDDETSQLLSFFGPDARRYVYK